MLRKLVVALAAGALITSFSMGPTTEAFAAKKMKKAKVAKVAPAPQPNPLACAVGVLFLPIKILTKQPIC
jgi:hypothetical protein